MAKKKAPIVEIPDSVQADLSRNHNSSRSGSNAFTTTGTTSRAAGQPSTKFQQSLKSVPSSVPSVSIHDAPKAAADQEIDGTGETWMMTDHEEDHSVADDTTVGAGSTGGSSFDAERTTRRTKIAILLLVLAGLYASSLFLYLSIKEAKTEVSDSFHHDATSMANELESSWKDYERSCLWIHESCRDWRSEEFGRHEFEILYHYLKSGDIDFYAAQWVPNVTHAERAQVEEEGAVGWGSVEGIDYQGIVGQEPDPDHPGELYVVPRSEQPFYFPVHFAEPKEKFTSAAHYDLFSSPWERPSVQRALDTGLPSLTPRGRLLGQTEDYSVVLYHPGTDMPAEFNIVMRDLASMVINIRSLLSRAARSQENNLAVYLYDSTLHALEEEIPPEFMGGIQIDASDDDTDHIVLNETSIDSLQDDAYLYFERQMPVAGREWTVVVVPVDDTYEPSIFLIVVMGSMIIAGALVLALWMYSNLLKAIERQRFISQAAAEAAIVRNMFPKHLRDRMVQDARQSFVAKTRTSAGKSRTTICTVDQSLTGQTLTSENLFGSRPIAELHPYTTVMFADLCGFTAWASQREPAQCFTLLEILFHSFDQIAKRRRVYKVETSGDIYVAVAGLPNPRSDHAVVMARFAHNCSAQMHKICKALEKTLGPDTSDLGIRIGLHSGQVVGGILRGDKGRFQLFGDTVHMAARMEKKGQRNKIHISQETAEELKTCGRGDWAIPREEQVAILGKGTVQTYFLEIDKDQLGETHKIVSKELGIDSKREEDAKTKRLIEWNVEVLSALVRKIVARRQANIPTNRRDNVPEEVTLSAIRVGHTVLDEVAEVIRLPSFNEGAVRKQVDPESIELDPQVVDQLTTLVTTIASMYRDNPFHNFEHASHVTMSVIKMMGRIVDPKEIAAKKRKGECDSQQFELERHDHTFGITSDPLTQFACAFSALIHDLDHTGVSNMILIQEQHPLTFKYNNKSVAEQNSVDLSWQLLMAPTHEALRACICATEEEFARFRSLVVNSVMATDIMDKELQAARKQRWNLAFSDDSQHEEDIAVATNRKATIVIEHLIQASDISHTMQHWHVYIKWNEMLFQELYKAYKEGRMEKDPSEGWHKGEIGFFDFYIIPLAKKLFTCGVFGVSSDEFLNYALTNRKEWEQKGEELVKEYLVNYENKYGKPADTTLAINTIRNSEDFRRSTMTTASMSDDDDSTEQGEEVPLAPARVAAPALKGSIRSSRRKSELNDSTQLSLPELGPIMEDLSNAMLGDDDLSSMEAAPPPPIEEVFSDELPSEALSLSTGVEISMRDFRPEHEDHSNHSTGDRSFMTAMSSFIAG